jgi:hypothetical protein
MMRCGWIVLGIGTGGGVGGKSPRAYEGGEMSVRDWLARILVRKSYWINEWVDKAAECHALLGRIAALENERDELKQHIARLPQMINDDHEMARASCIKDNERLERERDQWRARYLDSLEPWERMCCELGVDGETGP